MIKTATRLERRIAAARKSTITCTLRWSSSSMSRLMRPSKRVITLRCSLNLRSSLKVSSRRRFKVSNMTTRGSSAT